MEVRYKQSSDEPTPACEHQSSDEVTTLEKDEIFHLLQNYRRRAVVRYFMEFDGPVSISDLADQVTAWECETGIEDITKDQRQRVYIALYQSHLDKLDSNDVVNYDDEQGMITPGPNLSLLKAHFVASTPDATPVDDETEATSSVLWPNSYLGVALGGLIPVSGLALDIVPSQLLSIEVLNLVLVSAYIVLATLQYAMSK